MPKRKSNAENSTSAGKSKRSNKKSAAKKKAAKTRLSKIQKFEVRRVPRSALKGAEYNPRIIDAHARKKLEAKLKEVGLLSPIVWNEKTGNLVSGHQRLSCIDALEKDGNYELDVSVVQLSEKDEREQNIFFNNTSAQGSWDIEMLGDMLSDDDIDIAATGFDDMDLQILFDDTDYSSITEALNIFSEEAVSDKVKEDIDTLDELAEIKRKRKEYRNRDEVTSDSEFMAIVVFPNRDAQSRFMETCGVDPDERYLDGLRLQSVVEAARDRKLPKGDFIEKKFYVPKTAEPVLEDELARISACLTGRKNIRGRALEYMAVQSAQTPLESMDLEASKADEVPPKRKRSKLPPTKKSKRA